MRLRREYDDVAGPARRASSSASAAKPRGNLRTTLESLASQRVGEGRIDGAAGVPAERSPTARPRSRSALAGVTLPQTVNYLHQIESAPQVLSVKSLRIRTRPDKPELLDVTFTVSSFEPL